MVSGTLTLFSGPAFERIAGFALGTLQDPTDSKGVDVVLTMVPGSRPGFSPPAWDVLAPLDPGITGTGLEEDILPDLDRVPEQDVDEQGASFRVTGPEGSITAVTIRPFRTSSVAEISWETSLQSSDGSKEARVSEAVLSDWSHDGRGVWLAWNTLQVSSGVSHAALWTTPSLLSSFDVTRVVGVTSVGVPQILSRI